MLLHSTRCKSCTASPMQAVLQGIAPDGGLYVPENPAKMPFDYTELMQMDFLQMAQKIIETMLPGFPDTEKLVQQAYQNKFETQEITPLVQVGNTYVLELFHGPTCAFKDVALSMLPHLMTASKKALSPSGEAVILTATSGDTGKAALEGFHDVEGTKIIVFYPKNGVSPVQQLQMTTQEGKNVCVCAVEGNFDDCQRGVKNAFAGLTSLLPENKQLSSANSINIGRLVPQIVYYFAAYRQLIESGKIMQGQQVTFVVPTGNFGDILAGYYASMLGLPVQKLVCASNENDVLTEFFHTGKYNKNRPFIRTTSPSMDILVSSNLERLLYHASNGNTRMVSSLMKKLSEKGEYQISENLRTMLAEYFAADECTEEEAAQTIKNVWEEAHYLLDPHTAVAMHCAKKYQKDQAKDGEMVIVLSTASPYKFPRAVLNALTGSSPEDEFDCQQALCNLTGVPIPQALSCLKSKPVLHHASCKPEEMNEWILRYLKEN